MPSVSVGGCTAQVVRGFASWRWYAQFACDPIDWLWTVHHRFGSLFVLGDPRPDRVIWDSWFSSAADQGSGPGQARSQRRQIVAALSPDYNRQILSHPEQFPSRAFARRGPPGSAQNRVRAGLTTLNGEEHRQLRRLILPTMVGSALRSSYDRLVNRLQQVLKTWRLDSSNSNPPIIDLAERFRKLSLELSLSMLFGRERLEDAEVLGHLLEDWLRRCFSLSMWISPLHWPGSAYKRLLRGAEKLELHLQQLLTRRRRDCPADSPGDLLDSLLALQAAHPQMLTAEGLIGQTTFLFGASYETVAAALMWTAVLIALHPEVASRVSEELTTQLAGRVPTYDQLDRLPWLDAVIRESLRLFPPIPMTVRVAACPLQLGPIWLNSGDRIFTSQYITHRLAEVFVQPLRFQPQRWMEQETPGPYEYFPFGAGPRICPGYTLAMTILKLTLAVILCRWQIAVLPDTRIDRQMAVTLSVRGRLPVELRRPDRVLSPTAVQGNIHQMMDLPTSPSS